MGLRHILDSMARKRPKVGSQPFFGKSIMAFRSYIVLSELQKDVTLKITKADPSNTSTELYILLQPRCYSRLHMIADLC
jgi:hypothetical protein